jgi:hypothetical protein
MFRLLEDAEAARETNIGHPHLFIIAYSFWHGALKSYLKWKRLTS